MPRSVETDRVPPAAPTPRAGQPEAALVRAMFDRIAPRYDLLNRLLSLGTDVGWRRVAVGVLGTASGGTVLDGCCGTGDVLLEWLRRAPGNRGVGVDLSARMLALGRAKVARRGAEQRALLCLGDAERLPLADAAFDGAIVAFGIRNVPDPASALGELRRVLRVGAPLVVLEFGLPGGLLGRAYALYFQAVLPRVGGWLARDPGAYRYLPASVARFPGVERFAAQMLRAGFGRVHWRRLTGGVAWVCRGEAGAAV